MRRSHSSREPDRDRLKIDIPTGFASPVWATLSGTAGLPCVNDPGAHTKCKYLHARAAVSEGAYTLFQVMTPSNTWEYSESTRCSSAIGTFPWKSLLIF